MSAITTTSQSQSSITQHFNSEQLKVLKQQIAPKCSDTELDYFIEVCKQTNLSPFTREIYAISRETWNPETQRKEPKMSIQVSIDGLRKRAANSGYYDGSTTFWCGEDGKWLEVWLKSTPPSAAKTVVYRKGCGQPFTAVARFDAYKQDFKGKLSGLWEKMPDIMIGKCSEALALRKAFPEQTAGLYASEEMDQASNVSPQTQPVSTPQPEIATGWDDKLWAIFEKGVNKCATVGDLEKLIEWVSKTVQKYQPSQEQDREITQIIKRLGDELNDRTVEIPKPVKSAHELDESDPTPEEQSRIDSDDF
jgi:phage recombination protein Bet